MLHFEDFMPGEVRDLGRHTFLEEEIVGFARQYDPQRFHVDAQAARETPFGGLVASGWHTCGVLMRKMVDAYIGDSACVGSPGLDSLKWLKPVRPGDTLSFRSTVLEARPSASRPQVGLVKFRWEALDAAGAAVLSLEGWQIFQRRKT
jgi:acyl dehydratase